MCIHIHTNNRSTLNKRNSTILTWTLIRSVRCWWLQIFRTRAAIIRIYCNRYLRQYQVEHQTIERVDLGRKKKSKFSRKRCVGWLLRTRGPSIAGFLPIILANVTESTRRHKHFTTGGKKNTAATGWYPMRRSVSHATTSAIFIVLFLYIHRKDTTLRFLCYCYFFFNTLIILST